MRIVYKGNYIRMACGEIGLVEHMHEGVWFRKKYFLTK